jgi:dipeptidyl-peptidase-4
MGTPEENLEGYKKSAPTNFAGELKGKLLLLHGSSDDNVHCSNTLQLADALYKAGKHFELMIYPAKAHDLKGPETRFHVYETIARFFLENL